MRYLCLSSLLLAVSGFGQTRARTIRSAGEGVVSVRPDQVRITASVITQGTTAQEAADQNATLVNNVLERLRALLGANADVRTVSYSVSPNYRTNPGGGPPQLVGYTATNSIQVTSGDLSLAGRIIDTATQAGANSVGGLSFGLRDPEPQRQQALRAATQEARQHAESIAMGLGVRLGQVLSAEEGTVSRALTLDTRGVGAAAPTPVESGTLEVRATVTVEFEIQ